MQEVLTERTSIYDGIAIAVGRVTKSRQLFST